MRRASQRKKLIEFHAVEENHRVFCSEISKCVGDGHNYTSGRIALLHRTRGRNPKPLSGSAALSLTGMRPHHLHWLD